MKISKLLLPPVLQQNRVSDNQLTLLSPCIVPEDVHPVPVRRKSLIRIEMTTVWSRSAGDIHGKKVYYRKPLLTPEGKLDRERLALEILSHPY